MNPLPLQAFTADHRFVLAGIARAVGFADPVAVQLGGLLQPLLKAARRGPLVPIDDVLIRDWEPNVIRNTAGVSFGARVYQIEGVRFAVAACGHDDSRAAAAFSFTAVDRHDYARLYRIARQCRREAEAPAGEPVLSPDQRDTLWNNTIGYLERSSLRRIKEYGGRPKRGILLTGPPGNGKTSACRWLWDECRRRNWEWRLVTPDAYAMARRSGNAEAVVRALFTPAQRGIVFFDDMDLALRDREKVKETDDQAVFLSAMDGIEVKEGVAFVFTTNCPLDLIDRAFKRPGRIDVVVHLGPPDAALRRRLIDRWHPEIRAAVDADHAVATTDGFNFAEVEEVKNLLIMRHLDGGGWDWDWALRQLAANRQELTAGRRPAGFGALMRTNGHA